MHEVNIPRNLDDDRLVDTAQAAAVVGFSIPHFRRMYRKGKVPAPLRVGERKLGWRVRDLRAFISAKAEAAQ